MGFDFNKFDASEVDPSDYDALPAGEYVACIVDLEWRHTKAKTGRYLNLEIEVIEGKFKGRKLWDRLNLENPSEEAVKIALRTLSAICRAVGVMQPKNTYAIRDKPFIATVKVEEYNGSDQNVVKGYKPIRTNRQEVKKDEPLPLPEDDSVQNVVDDDDCPF